jgi:tripartite-type tricarboxylate transporter receptor subunit TctC
MMKSEKRFASLLVCISLLAAMVSANAQNKAEAYPNRPIKLIVPFSAGGLGDTIARTLSQRLSDRMKQPVVVDNRPGASEALAAVVVKQSPADGYTLFLSTETGMVFNPITKKNLPYDPLRDFTPIAMLIESPFYLLVNPSIEARTVADLIKLAKSAPGKLNYASIGPGSMQHLLAEMFKVKAKVDLTHVPYKASGPATIELVAGQVDVMFQGGGTVISMMNAGKLRGLATTANARTNAMPNLPTMAEAGTPDFNASSWFALFGPAGMPKPIVDQLYEEISSALRDPAIVGKFQPQGLKVSIGAGKELTERIKQDGPYWSQIIRAARLEFE